MSVNNVGGLSSNTIFQSASNVQPKEQKEEILIKPNNVSSNVDSFEKQGLTKKQKTGIIAGAIATVGAIGGIIYAVKKGKIGSAKKVAEETVKEMPKAAEKVEVKLSSVLQERLEKLGASPKDYIQGEKMCEELSKYSDETISSLSNRIFDRILDWPKDKTINLSALETDFTPEGLKKVCENCDPSVLLAYLSDEYNGMPNVQAEIIDVIKNVAGDGFIAKI